jgi:hypothetical protein
MSSTYSISGRVPWLLVRCRIRLCCGPYSCETIRLVTDHDRDAARLVAIQWPGGTVAPCQDTGSGWPLNDHQGSEIGTGRDRQRNFNEKKLPTTVKDGPGRADCESFAQLLFEVIFENRVANEIIESVKSLKVY